MLLKKHLSLVALLLFMICYHAGAQSLVQSIRGVITDKDSKVPLPGANVIVMGTEPLRFAQTDVNGRFKVDSVPVGRQNIRITFTGYEDMNVPNIVVGSAKEIVLNLELQESLQRINEVVVHGERRHEQPVNDYSLVSTHTISLEQTNRYAGSFTDLGRALLNMPGVSNGGNDISNEIVIRGNSPRGLLWQLEGIEVPSPNHFNTLGASSGAVSAISSAVLGTSDFSTGAFAPEYGNALSGVFDIKLRKGNNEKREYTAEASFLGLSLGAEGPFKKDYAGSYLVNYRYSTLSLISAMGIHLIGNTNPGFQDLCVKINLPNKKLGTFNVFVLGGLSDLTRSSTSKGITTKVDEGSDFLVTGVSNSHILTDKLYLNTTVAFTASRARNATDRNLTPDKYYRTETDRFVDYAVKLNSTLNYKINPRHDLKTGIILSYLGYDYYQGLINTKTLGTTDKIKEKGGTEVLQAFADWRWRIFTDLTWNTGFHVMYFVLNGHTSFEPRSSIRWQVAKKQALSLGFGLHTRREALVTYEAAKYTNIATTYPNHDLDFTKAAHFVLGYDYMILPDLHLKAETYYQLLYQVPIQGGRSTYSSLNYPTIQTTTALYNNGFGKNYGIELTLEKFFSNGYFFMANGSLYESTYTPGDGIVRKTRYDGNYVVNVLGGQEFKIGKKKNNAFAYGLHATAAGGKRYTPLDEAATIKANRAIYITTKTFGSITPAYYRFDVYISYTTNFKRCGVTYRLDVQDFTNHHNVYDIEYNAINKTLDPLYQGQILPVLDVKIEF